MSTYERQNAMTALQRTFLHHRQHGYNPAAALQNARHDIAAGKGHWPHISGYSRPGPPFQIGRNACRWYEDPEAVARSEGFADEVGKRLNYRYGSRVFDHTGWYLEDDYSDELARGVVYRLPHGRGFLVGVADPFNSGPAMLAVAPMPGDPDDDESALMDAARAADRLAELYAEHERDYRRVANARMRYDDMGEEVKDTRKRLLALFAELRPLRKSLCGNPNVIGALRNRIESMLETIREKREAREELRNDYSREDGWQDA